MNENNPNTPPIQEQTSRYLRPALAISVALNLLICGVLVGGLFITGREGGRPSMTRDLAFGPIAEALRPEDRRALRTQLQARAPELRSANAQRQRDIVAVQSALRAQPFDPAAFSLAITQLRGRLQDQLALGFDGLSAVVMAMPDAERRALADRLERGLRRGEMGDNHIRPHPEKP